MGFQHLQKKINCIKYLVSSNSILDDNIVDTRMRQTSLCHRLENGLYRKWHHLECDLTWTAIIVVCGLSVSSCVCNCLQVQIININHGVQYVYVQVQFVNIKLVSTKQIYLCYFVSWDTLWLALSCPLCFNASRLTPFSIMLLSDTFPSTSTKSFSFRWGNICIWSPIKNVLGM